MSKSFKLPPRTYPGLRSKSRNQSSEPRVLTDAANLFWVEFAGNDGLLDGLKQAMRNPGMRAALNTLRSLPVRQAQGMDPLVFAGYVQGYHACIDALISLASTQKQETVEATFGAD